MKAALIITEAMAPATAGSWGGDGGAVCPPRPASAPLVREALG